MYTDIEFDCTPDHRRQRLLAVAVGAAVLITAMLIAAQYGYTRGGGGSTKPLLRAEAVGVVVAAAQGETGRIAPAATLAGDSRSAARRLYSYPANGSLVHVEGVRVDATRDATSSTARGTSQASAISLFGNRIRIESAQMTATAAIERGAARGTVQLSSSTRITVNGKPVQASPNQQVVVAGLGTVSLNEQAVVAAAPRGDSSSGPRVRVAGAIAHVRLTHAAAGLPAGSEIVIGRVDATVRQKRAAPKTSQQAPGASTRAAAAAHPVAPANFKVIAGEPKPGEAAIPRRDAGAVRGSGPAAQGNLSGYLIPVLGEVSFVDTWGAPRATVARHEGTDLFAPQGTPIIAPVDGVLDRVGWNRVGGHRFWLWDKYGNGFYNAHLSAFSTIARDGAQVRAGDVIGFVGTSGDAQGTPPHLHFEIHPGGREAVNPYPYLKAWRDGVQTAAPTSAVAGGTVFGAPLVLLRSTDIGAESGLSDAPLMERVQARAQRPVHEEDTPVQGSEALELDLAASALDGS